MQQFGEAATYIAPNEPAPGVSLTAIRQSQSVDPRDDENQLGDVGTQRFKIGKDPAAVGGGVVAPRSDATLTVGSVVWAVRTAPIDRGAFWVLECLDPSASEIGIGNRKELP